VLRFWKVSFQTVAAPVLTAVLYLLIFGHVLEDHVKVFETVGLHQLPDPGPGDDERAAERLRQQQLQR
jgi:ABC-2 type transport system permease protein